MYPTDKIRHGIRVCHKGKAPGVTENPIPGEGLAPLESMTVVNHLTVAVPVRVMVTSPLEIPSRIKVQISSYL